MSSAPILLSRNTRITDWVPPMLYMSGPTCVTEIMSAWLVYGKVTAPTVASRGGSGVAAGAGLSSVRLPSAPRRRNPA